MNRDTPVVAVGRAGSRCVLGCMSAYAELLASLFAFPNLPDWGMREARSALLPHPIFAMIGLSYILPLSETVLLRLSGHLPVLANSLRACSRHPVLCVFVGCHDETGRDDLLNL